MEKEKDSEQIEQTEDLMTDEQRDIIEKFTGENVENFCEKALTDMRSKNFATKVASDMRHLDEIAKKASLDNKYNPSLSYETIKKITGQPEVATRNDLENWLKRPSQYSKQLGNLSQYLGYVVGQYNTLIKNSNASKSFSYVLKPQNVTKAEDLTSKDFLRDFETANKICKKLNIRYQMAKADLSVLYSGAFFFYVKESTDSLAMYQLPNAYCTITSPFDYGWRFSFDLTYFDNVPGDIDVVAPELALAYGLFLEERKKGSSGSQKLRYYPMSPKISGVFLSDILFPDVVPPFTSSMGAALDVLSYKKIIEKKITFDLYKLIALRAPIDPKTGKTTIPYDLGVDMVTAIRGQLPDFVVPYITPFESKDIGVSQSSDLDKIVNIGQKNMSDSSGMAQPLLGSGDISNGMSLSIASRQQVARDQRNMYLQYENFVNFLLDVKCGKFKFRIQMFGNNFTKRDDLLAYEKLAKSTPIAKAFLEAELGVEPFEAVGFEQLINLQQQQRETLPMSEQKKIDESNNGQVDDNKGTEEEKEPVGRPRKPEDELSDGGNQSREYGS